MHRGTRRLAWGAWARLGRWAVLGAVILAAALGFVGYSAYDSSQTVGNRLYSTARLFLFEGDLSGPLPWALEVARWAAPFAAALAAGEALVALARDRTAGYRARFLRSHLIVVGLGDRGWDVVRRAVEAGRAVSALEADPHAPHVAAARAAGVPVVLGDAGDVDRLRAAGIRHCSSLIALTGSADANLAVASALRAPDLARPPDFAAYIELPDAELLREIQQLVDESDGTRPEFFNLAERAGPMIIDRFAPWGSSGRPQPTSILVVGGTTTALSLLGAVAAQWEAAVRGAGVVGDAGTVLDVMLLVPDDDRALDEVTRRVAMTHPDFHPDADHDVLTRVGTASLDAVDPGRAISTYAGRDIPRLAVVATPNAATSLRITSALQEQLPVTSTVVVVTPRRGPLDLLRHQEGSPARPRVHLFDLSAELCRAEAISQGRIELLARQLHNGYLRHLDDAALSRSRESARPWDDLAETYRSSNRAAARAMWDLLHREGWRIVPRSSHRSATTPIPDHSVDRMAAAEHARWARERAQPTTSWAAVPALQQEQSRAQIRRYPAALAAAGLEIRHARSNPAPHERNEDPS